MRAVVVHPADAAVAAGLMPFRRPELLPLVLGMDGVARRPDGALVYFFQPAVPYGAFAERVPLAEAETVPRPDGLDTSRGAAVGISGVAAWTGLARTGQLQPGDSVLTAKSAWKHSRPSGTPLWPGRRKPRSSSRRTTHLPPDCPGRVRPSTETPLGRKQP